MAVFSKSGGLDKLARFSNQTSLRVIFMRVWGKSVLQIDALLTFNLHRQQFYVRIPNFDGVGDGCLLVHANESRQSALRVLLLVMKQIEVSAC